MSWALTYGLPFSSKMTFLPSMILIVPLRGTTPGKAIVAAGALGSAEEDTASGIANGIVGLMSRIEEVLVQSMVQSMVESMD